MSNEPLHTHDLTQKSICQTNHCIKDFINQTILTIVKCINVWCFDTYVTSGVFEVKEL
jgi:hypothetical protein